MDYLVGYDIADPRRLRKVAHLLESFGYRVQYSVFICDLSQAAWEELTDGLHAHIDPEEDRVFLLPVCRSCQQRILELGTTSLPDLDEPCIIV